MHERRFHGGVQRLRSPERVQRLEVNQVVALTMKGIEASSVLDIGTGSGLFAEEFIRCGLHAAGIDANPEMVAEAGKMVPQGDFRQAEAEQLPFPDGAFDLVFMGVLLHEADNPVKALSEAWRVATRRVAVLEWPYREEETPPPLAHRLTPEKVAEIARKTGMPVPDQVDLEHTVLYLFTR